MSHLVVDQKVFDHQIKVNSTDSERDSRELKRESPRYVNKIVYSDKRIDRRLVLLYRALNIEKDIKTGIEKGIENSISRWD